MLMCAHFGFLERVIIIIIIWVRVRVTVITVIIVGIIIIIVRPPKNRKVATLFSAVSSEKLRISVERIGNRLRPISFLCRLPRFWMVLRNWNRRTSLSSVSKRYLARNWKLALRADIVLTYGFIAPNRPYISTKSAFSIIKASPSPLLLETPLPHGRQSHRQHQRENAKFSSQLVRAKFCCPKTAEAFFGRSGTPLACSHSPFWQSPGWHSGHKPNQTNPTTGRRWLWLRLPFPDSGRLFGPK